MGPMSRGLAWPARGADRGHGEAVVFCPNGIGHVRNVGALDSDVVVVVVAEADASAAVTLSTDAGSGPGGAASSNPAQTVDAVVDTADISPAKLGVTVAVLETKPGQFKRSRLRAMDLPRDDSQDASTGRA